MTSISVTSGKALPHPTLASSSYAEPKSAGDIKKAQEKSIPDNYIQHRVSITEPSIAEQHMSSPT